MASAVAHEQCHACQRRRRRTAACPLGPSCALIAGPCQNPCNAQPLSRVASAALVEPSRWRWPLALPAAMCQ